MAASRRRRSFGAERAGSSSWAAMPASAAVERDRHAPRTKLGAPEKCDARRIRRGRRRVDGRRRGSRRRCCCRPAPAERSLTCDVVAPRADRRRVVAADSPPQRLRGGRGDLDRRRDRRRGARAGRAEHALRRDVGGGVPRQRHRRAVVAVGGVAARSVAGVAALRCRGNEAPRQSQRWPRRESVVPCLESSDTCRYLHGDLPSGRHRTARTGRIGSPDLAQTPRRPPVRGGRGWL